MLAALPAVLASCALMSGAESGEVTKLVPCNTTTANATTLGGNDGLLWEVGFVSYECTPYTNHHNRSLAA
jgi:hypothetical protein